MPSGDRKYIYKGKDGRDAQLIYNFQGLNHIKGTCDNDAQTGFMVRYDGNDTLYDLNIESAQKGGGTNLLFALIDLCYALRNLEGIEIHHIKGDLSPYDNDVNRLIYWKIYNRLKETYLDVELKYYDSQHDPLPLTQAATSPEYYKKVRYMEFVFP